MSAPHPGCIDWPSTSATMSSPFASPAEVERARQRAAAETMAAYPKPVPMPSPPGGLERVRFRQVDFDEWGPDERALAKSYVYDVTLVEERNHGSLLALLEAIATLRASDDPTSRACGDELAKRVAADYPGVKACLRGGPLPESMRERRRLARAASRDYGRCPRAWRYL